MIQDLKSIEQWILSHGHLCEDTLLVNISKYFHEPSRQCAYGSLQNHEEYIVTGYYI